VKNLISGSHDPAFRLLRDVFESNFTKGDELGSACCVYINGRKVFDMWGGYADKNKTRIWEKDTLVGFYSAGKPFAALCVLQLVDSGQLELDAPVSNWWPEFAAAGKGQITVRQLLCHQACIPAIRQRLPDDAMLDWALMTKVLAEEAPWYEPGSRHTYHTNTYGFLAGELVRRISGMGFGEYFRKKIAEHLDIDVIFGLNETELSRVADLVWRPSGDAPEYPELDENVSKEQLIIINSYFNPPGFSSMGLMNTKKWRMAVIPSTNGHGTARGLAKIYHVLSHGGMYKQYKILSNELIKEASTSQSKGPCPVLETEVTFGLGFQLTRPDRPLGPNPKSFGHYGTGGSLGFADPDAKIGFGYVMNDIIPRWQNPRNKALVDAVYECI
jgi:CubicO group peptidase (beta-lactamase class C family)